MTLSLFRSEAGPPVVVEVWGDGALFTRPEFRVERLTYSVITPTAAVGVLESIFWKPEFRWVPVAIEVLEPIRQFTLRRNETHDLPTMAGALAGERVDTVSNRDQRHAVCLRDVRYRIHAHVEPAPHATTTEAGYREQFRRRVARGACFSQPYLGTKEFQSKFGEASTRPAIPDDEDLGMMLHRIHRNPLRFDWFHARLDRGVLHVPPHGVRVDTPGVA
jgi:CRISPR-associated protein Cas5d